MEDAEQPLFVPVRRSAAGTVTPLTARLPQGPRVGIAFTSLEAMRAASRPGQDWIRLAAAVLHGLLGPLGIGRIQVDPVLIVADLSRTAQVRNVPEPSPATTPAVSRTGRPQAVAVSAAGVADAPLGAIDSSRGGLTCC
jgi:hypothetical protein